ncbi:Sensor protein CzcS [subsurface metagenome]
MECGACMMNCSFNAIRANALRHTPPNGTIELSVEPAAEGKTSIVLANSGDPIPAADLEKVFDRLYRGEYARSSPGSGLGLTIAKRIAELHGGSLSIRNRAGGGVVVEMIL